MPETYTCWKCGSPLPDLLLPLPRREECPACRAELHVCRMCEFFDAAAPQQCRETVAEHVPDKSRANFCGYFSITPRAYTGSPDPAAGTRRDLDALFDTDLMRSNAKGDIAAMHILSGEVDKGCELAQEIVEHENYAQGTQRVAAALIRVGRFDKLADYLPLIPDTGHDVRTFREIAYELVKSGNVRQLGLLLGNHPSDVARAHACLGAYDQLRSE